MLDGHRFEKKICQRRSSLYKKYLRNPTCHRLNAYRQFRNFVTNKLRHAKSEYFYDKFNSVKNNARKTWEYINSLLGKKKGKSANIDSVKLDDEIITDKGKIADAFNEFFSTIGTKLSNQQTNTVKEKFKTYVNTPVTQSLFLKPIKPKELMKIVLKMKNNTSPGYDNISIKVVKKVIPHISNVLCKIFNCSMCNGVVPDKMKIARVTPIHKKGDTSIMNNYRPISVLTIFTKIFERCMYNRVTDFLNKHKILFKNQFGFRHGHSTSSAILELIHKITQAIEKKEFTLSVFIDLSKAFDVIDHTILIHKLKYYGIRGKCLNWFESYLNNRQQFTVVNGTNSKYNTVRCGVPQGSILGPLLFLIYVNDLPQCSQSLHYILFADDTSVFVSGNDLSSLVVNMNIQLTNIATWMEANKL